MSDTERLEPCPFCSATAEEFQLQPYQMHNLGGEPTDWAVECANCAAFGPTALTSGASATAWNTRASHADPLRRALEEISRIVEDNIVENDEPHRAHWHGQTIEGPAAEMVHALLRGMQKVALAALSSGENNNGE